MQKKRIRVLVFTAFLVALEIVLNRFLSFNTLGLKIGFAFLPGVVAAILFGPVAAAAVNGIGDFLGAILIPIGPYHLGFTICGALMGVMYGMFLHTDPVDRSLEGKNLRFSVAIHWNSIRFFPNVVIPVVINNLIIGLFLNTVWITMLYGSKTYGALLLSRLLTEYSILVPLELVMIPLLLQLKKPLAKIVGKRGTVGRKSN